MSLLVLKPICYLRVFFLCVHLRYNYLILVGERRKIVESYSDTASEAWLYGHYFYLMHRMH